MGTSGRGPLQAGDLVFKNKDIFTKDGAYYIASTPEDIASVPDSAVTGLPLTQAQADALNAQHGPFPAILSPPDVPAGQPTQPAVLSSTNSQGVSTQSQLLSAQKSAGVTIQSAVAGPPGATRFLGVDKQGNPTRNPQDAVAFRNKGNIFQSQVENKARIPTELQDRNVIDTNLYPHYFKERSDNIFFPDVLIYVCGANVSPHLKGSVTITLGLNDSSNTASFVLDNSNDKFVITTENAVFNKFNAGGNPNYFHDFDEGAKAKIYLYKNNALPIPGSPGSTYVPNDEPDDTAGRRLPLYIGATIFHRMDPVRIWVRATPYDEWIPAFTGYLQTNSMSDDWITHNREIHVNCSDIRESMRKMRIQNNTVLFQLPGSEETTDARTFLSQGGDLKQAASAVTNANSGIARNSKFWTDTVTGDSAYTFPFVNLSFKKLSELVMTGGHIDGIPTAPGQPTQTDQIKLDNYDKIIKQSEAEIERLQQQNDKIAKSKGKEVSGADKAAALKGTSLSKATAVIKDKTDEDIDKQENRNSGDIIGLRKRIETVKKEIEKLKKVIQKGGNRGGTDINGIGRFSQGIKLRYPGVLEVDAKTAKQNQDILAYWYALCLFGTYLRASSNTDIPKHAEGIGRLAYTASSAKDDLSKPPLYRNGTPFEYWTTNSIVDPIDGAGTRCRWDDFWAPDNQAVHWLLPSGKVPIGTLGQQLEALYTNNPHDPNKSVNIAADDRRIFEEVLISEGNVASNRQWTSRQGLLEQFAEVVDYKFWITGCGDMVFEFPTYDFDAQDFGNWSNVLTVDDHAISSNLDEESGDPPTFIVATGSYTQMPSTVGEGAIYDYVAPPYAIARAPNLMGRFGVKIETIDFPWVSSTYRLKQLATLHMQKNMGLVESCSADFGWRPWLIPNKPFYFKPRDRVSLINGVTHTINIHGDCSTSVELQYTRMVDTCGIRRYISGGAHMPIAFATIPGSGNIASKLSNLAASIKRFSQAKFLGPLDANADASVRARRQEQLLTLPRAYDQYNVIPMSSFITSTLVSKINTVSKVLNEAQSNAASPNVPNVSPVTVNDAKNTLAQYASNAGKFLQSSAAALVALSKVQGSQTDTGITSAPATAISVTPTASPDIKQTAPAKANNKLVLDTKEQELLAKLEAEKNNNGKGTVASPSKKAAKETPQEVDIRFMAQYIAKEEALISGGISEQDRINLANVLLNAAKRGNANITNPKKIDGYAASTKAGKLAYYVQEAKEGPNGSGRGSLNIPLSAADKKIKPSAEQMDVARRVLAGDDGTEDKTQGSTRLSRNFGVGQADDRGCNALEYDANYVQVDATDVGGGKTIADTPKFLFFTKRKPKDVTDVYNKYATDTKSGAIPKFGDGRDEFAARVFQYCDQDAVLASLFFALLAKESNFSNITTPNATSDLGFGQVNYINYTKAVRYYVDFKGKDTAEFKAFTEVYDYDASIKSQTLTFLDGSILTYLPTVEGTEADYYKRHSSNKQLNAGPFKLSSPPYNTAIPIITEPDANIKTGAYLVKSAGQYSAFKLAGLIATRDSVAHDLDKEFTFEGYPYTATQLYLAFYAYCKGNGGVYEIVARANGDLAKIESALWVKGTVNPKSKATPKAKFTSNPCGDGYAGLQAMVKAFKVFDKFPKNKTLNPIEACKRGDTGAVQAAKQILELGNDADRAAVEEKIKTYFKGKK
jgi:hypothetical protein